MTVDPISNELAREAFTKKYQNGSDWDGHSGGGSDPTYNLPYRSFLESFLRLNSVRSVIDIGCGDWQFSRYIDFTSVTYMGFDLVDDLVQANNRRFGSERISFSSMPPRLRDLPTGDLLIMKDVLQHLPNRDILAFRDELFPRFRFCLLTNSYRKLNAARNIDVTPGGFRCLDLLGAPYDLKGAYVLQFTSPLWEELRTLLCSFS